ncbi:MAG: twin-arginine translocase TatA/TatE family subunit [Solirubrobacteraceae bacterium]
MGLDNPIHLMFLLVVLLLVFGAKRLPELGHSLGTGLRGFKEAIGGEGVSSSLSVTQAEHAPAAEPIATAPVPTTPAPTTPVAAVPLATVPLATVPLAGVQDERSA